MEYKELYFLMIEDNGVGFNTEILTQNNKGMGFRCMENRLDAVDGF